MNFDDVVLAPLYRSFGVDASLVIAPGSTGEATYTLRVIDQTAGVEVDGGPLSMPSVKAVAMCKMADVVALGFQPEDLLKALIIFNGNTWQVKNAAPKPNPDGRWSGELQLVLINGSL